MRIIAGEFRSRKLISPPEGTITRPIPDRVKESLFSLLRGNIEDAAVLDCFAGSGAMGLEAISRGASRCVFVERDRRVVDIIKKNVAMLGCEDRCEVVMADALGMGVLSRCPRPVDIIFFDPPYPMVLDGAGWGRVSGQFARLCAFLADDGFGVLRTPWPFTHAETPEGGEVEIEIEDQDEDRGERGRGRRGKKDRAENGRRAGTERGGADRGGKRRTPRPEFDDEGDEILGELEESEWRALAGEMDDGEDDEFDDAALGAADEDDNPPPPAVRHPVDLKLPGLIGPETHVYAHTALHFYMRDRGQGGESEKSGGGEGGAGA